MCVSGWGLGDDSCMMITIDSSQLSKCTDVSVRWLYALNAQVIHFRMSFRVDQYKGLMLLLFIRPFVCLYSVTRMRLELYKCESLPTTRLVMSLMVGVSVVGGGVIILLMSCCSWQLLFLLLVLLSLI